MDRAKAREAAVRAIAAALRELPKGSAVNVLVQVSSDGVIVLPGGSDPTSLAARVAKGTSDGLEAALRARAEQNEKGNQ
jgi:hypothetical protein